jgi:hypothetical protein
MARRRRRIYIQERHEPPQEHPMTRVRVHQHGAGILVGDYGDGMVRWTGPGCPPECPKYRPPA